MTDQPSLLDLMTAPYQRHSETSRAAAESIKPHRGPMHEKILRLLKMMDEWDGATDEQMQAALKMKESTQRPRRRELQLWGDVIDSGKTRPTASGRMAVVWKLA